MSKRKSVIIMLIIFLAIGFATVSTTLVINGILAIGENKDDFNIIFTSAKLDGRKRNDFISEDKKHINFVSNELKTLEDKAILDYEVTNTSRNYDADVSVTCTAGENEYITFEYTPHQMEVASGETKTVSLTASMFKVVDEATEVPIECTLTATAKTRESLGEEYIEPFSKSGVMMKASNDYSNPGKIWGYRNNITRIVFEDKLLPHETIEELTFDISDLQDESVMAYLIPNGETLTTTKDTANKDLENTTAYTLYIQGDTGVIASQDSSELFYRFNNLLEIENLKYLDTSNVSTLSNLFSNCTNLLSADLSSFDTSNVTNMMQMFWGCKSLTELDLSNFDTSNVTNMDGIFNNCLNLSSLNISNFNTKKVTNTHAMFMNCEKITNLDLSNFDTSSVTNMSVMFAGCRLLVRLNISCFNTSSATNMSTMFQTCINLENLDLSNFDTSNVTDMSSMFASCGKITNLNLANFNTSNVTNMRQMFSSCRNLTTLDLSSFDTSKVTDMSSMFNWCGNLTSLDIRNFDFNNLISESSKSNIFAYVNSEATVYIKDLETQEWILALGEVNQPSWTADNFVIVGA